MWSNEFWLAVLERVLRGSAAALGGALVAGDWVFDVFNLNSLKDGLAVVLGGALTSLLLALVGQGLFPGNGPSITGREVLDPNHPDGPTPPQSEVGEIGLGAALIVAVVLGVILLYLFGAFGPMPLK